jgi:hypothetical protein
MEKRCLCWEIRGMLVGESSISIWRRYQVGYGESYFVLDSEHLKFPANLIGLSFGNVIGEFFQKASQV